MNLPTFKIALLAITLAIYLPTNLVANNGTIETETSNDIPTSVADKTSYQTFGEALNAHLTAILTSDQKPYLPVEDENGISSIISAKGSPFSKFADLSAHSRSWVEQGTWEFHCAIVKEEVTNDMAFAMLNVDYFNSNGTADDEYHPFYLVVIFSKSDTGWNLVHEQVTPNISKKNKVLVELEYYQDLEKYGDRKN